MHRLLLFLCLLAYLATSAPAAEELDPPSSAFWRPYANRYAAVVMAGNVEGREPHYGWYWSDTYGMVRELIDREGFPAENVFLLAYGPKADKHADAVRGPSTTTEIRKLFKHLAEVAGPDDLVYLYWVDHGDRNAFATYDGQLPHRELGGLIRSIPCRTFIGAFNPCNSGALINDVHSDRAVIVTSVTPDEVNRWGWAGQWRLALGGGEGNSTSDTDGDGRISIAEAYAFSSARANRAGEHPLIDDNGDGRAGQFGTKTYDPGDPKKDGHRAAGIALDAWRDVLPGEPDWELSKPDRSFSKNLDPIETLVSVGRRTEFGGTGEAVQAPMLFFCHSRETAAKCRKARARLFLLPKAAETPFYAPAFRCSLVDLSSLGPGDSPHADRTTCPAVIVISPTGEIAKVLSGNKIRDASVAASMKAVLAGDEARRLKRVASRASPHLREMTKLAKKREIAVSALRRAQKNGGGAEKVVALLLIEASFANAADRIREILDAAREDG